MAAAGRLVGMTRQVRLDDDLRLWTTGLALQRVSVEAEDRVVQCGRFTRTWGGFEIGQDVIDDAPALIDRPVAEAVQEEGVRRPSTLERVVVQPFGDIYRYSSPVRRGR